MQLTLIRHAIAVERSAGGTDAARPLSPEGIDRFRQVVRGLDALGFRCDQLVHSPRLRAVQTAELAVPLVRGELQVSPLLAEAPGPALFDLLDGDRVALVGHSPWLEQLLALLTAGEVGRYKAFRLKKGGVAVLEGTARPAGMHLTALLPPRVTRRIGSRR